MTAPVFLTTAQVAELLGLSDAGFLRRRDHLEVDNGFPQPMPTSRRPLRWRRDQVIHWIEGQGLPRDAGSDTVDPYLIATGKVALLAEARRP